MLENVDIDYENSLKNIYNVNIEDEESEFESPFFKAMKIPGQISSEDTTESDRTTEQFREENIDQGG